MKRTFILFATIINIHILSQSVTYNYEITWSEQLSNVNYTLNSVSTSLYTNSKFAWICGNNGTVLKTNNEGLNWINVGSNGIPANIDLINISMLDSATVITSGKIGSTAYVYRTSNAGQNWTQVFTEENGFVNGISLNFPYSGFMVGNPVGGRWSLWKSTDLGVTWDSTGFYLPQINNESGWNNSYYVVPWYYGYGRVWFGTNNHRIYYSSNSGINWIVQQVPEQNIYSISWISNYELAGGNNLIASSDYGNQWSQQNSPGNGTINGITAPPIMLITPHDVLYAATPLLYIRGDNKIFYTDNGAVSWEVKYQSPSGSYKHINSNGNNIWAVRDNGSITRGKIDVITNVPPNTYPYSFELRQNYPNPFNPKTNIPITIYRSTHLILNIYNSSGELITNLVNDYIPLQIWDIIKGYTYIIEWDGTNYPSDVYYYQVIADDYTATKKMVLVK